LRGAQGRQGRGVQVKGVNDCRPAVVSAAPRRFAKWDQATPRWGSQLCARPRDALLVTPTSPTNPRRPRALRGNPAATVPPLFVHAAGCDDRRMTTRRLPVPWRAERIAGGYVVRDANGQALAYVYSRANAAGAMQAKVLTEDDARRVAVNIARLPARLRRPQPRAAAPRSAASPRGRHGGERRRARRP
jgi:hypothetical protein